MSFKEKYLKIQQYRRQLLPRTASGLDTILTNTAEKPDVLRLLALGLGWGKSSITEMLFCRLPLERRDVSIGPADSASEERLHTQFHEGIWIHVEGGLKGLLGILVQLLVVSQVGLAGEALITENTGERLLFRVNASVAYKLGRHTKGLAAFQALVALGLCMNSPVVLQCHQVGELLLAH